jgi:hypothetical protein
MRTFKRVVVFNDKVNAVTVEHNKRMNYNHPFRIRILDTEIEDEEIVLCELVMSSEEFKEFIERLIVKWNDHSLFSFPGKPDV